MMMIKKRLINANDLRTQFDDIPPYIGLAGSLVQQYIDKATTVDAVEVVRCKDCKKRYTPDCIMSDGLGEAGDNDFCSYGERKDK